MAPLPSPPPEPDRCTSLDGYPPNLRSEIENVLRAMRARGYDAVVFESYRSPERAAWLYGFGRKYDDGRGVVTNAADSSHTWHGYYLAADIISASREWDAPEDFWQALGECARAEGLAWGGDWPTMRDKPHVQHGAPMRVSPSPRAAMIVAHYGLPALWQEVGAL